MSVQFDVRRASEEAVTTLVRESKLPHFIATTLVARGITTPQAVEEFFHPSLETDWASPYVILGLERVVDELEAAIRAHKHVVVFGDFDVDGITATTLLTRALRTLGAQATPFIPKRFDEGYGLSTASLDRLMNIQPTPEVLVTVDCGISCKDAVVYAQSLGLHVIITDHHEPGDAVPEHVALLDPKMTGPERATVLAGAGVALKVVQALGARFGTPHLWRDYTDFAALGTVADLMPMTGENRALVAHGIALMNKKTRPCFASLFAQAAAPEKASATNLSFSAIPRLNAAGRMGDSTRALELLMCDEPARCQHLAEQLEEINNTRRSIESELTELAQSLAENVYHGQRALVVAGKGWHEGVKGIVASRLVGTYGVPTILFSIDGNEARGSGRSVGHVNLFRAVESCADLLTRFGGHASAVGVTLPVENLEAFTERMCAHMEALPEAAFHPALSIDARVSLSELTLENVRMLERLEPFGQENPVPCFIAQNVTLSNHRAVGADKNHFSCTLSDGTGNVAAIMFHCSNINVLLDTNSVVNAAFTLQIDTWRNRESVKAMLKTISPAQKCAALEACLSEEELSCMSSLYANAEDGIQNPAEESIDEIERYENEREQARAAWEKIARENPAELRQRIIQTLIGSASLHASQREVLENLANNTSTLAVMATGRGKSLTFQVHATLLALAQHKVSVFVYPLRALIADQAWHLNNALVSFGVSAVTLTGESTPQERELAYSELRAGNIDIVLTTPEFLVFHAHEFASCGRVGFVAVDEAHHIGQAKAGNRVAYQSLGEVLQQLNNPVVLATTATAPTNVARDIARVLNLDTYVFDNACRSNLRINDRRNTKNRTDYLANIVARGEQTIVYVSTREQSVTLARMLRNRVPQLASHIGFYNAGLSRAERNSAEALFRTGAFCTLVATSAFGEGVNIAHIRHVVLYGLPFNEVEFNQMSGRAGRDGEEATVHVLFENVDAKTNKALVCDATPNRAQLVDVYQFLRSEQSACGPEAFVVNLDDLPLAAREKGISPAAMKCGIEVFRELGFIDARPGCFCGKRVWAIRVKTNPEKVDLAQSVRYCEGLGDIEQTRLFGKWVLGASARELLQHVVYPIIPST